MDHRHEVGLQASGVVDEAIQLRHRIERPKDCCLEVSRHAFELNEVCSGVSKHEIKVERGHRSPVQRGRSIADEHHLQPLLLQGDQERRQQGDSVYWRQGAELQIAFRVPMLLTFTKTTCTVRSSSGWSMTTSAAHRFYTPVHHIDRAGA